MNSTTLPCLCATHCNFCKSLQSPSRSLFAPKVFSSLEGSTSQSKARHTFDKFICKLPVVGLSCGCNFAMGSRQVLSRTYTVVAMLLLARQVTVGVFDLANTALENQRRFVDSTVGHGEILLESKVKPCGFTRLERDDRLILKQCRDAQPNIAYAVTFDCDRLNAFNVKLSMLKILEHALNTRPRTPNASSIRLPSRNS